MSVTSPESDFHLIEDTNGGGGIIIWSDGHSVSAVSIEAALKAGMKHFWDIIWEGEHFIICSKEGITNHVVKHYMALWEEENSSGEGKSQ
jgi:hypothetical protein